MTTYHLAKTQLDHVLRDAGLVDSDPIRVAFSKDPHDSFHISAAPASVLRGSLEVKTAVAKQRGKAIVGDADLLVELADLKDAPIVGVSTETTDAHIMVYLRADSHVVVGSLCISKS
jgi:hypothetical protein